MKCRDCGYYWKEPGDEYHRCHYPDNDLWPAPCEQEDDQEPDYDEYD